MRAPRLQGRRLAIAALVLLGAGCTPAPAAEPSPFPVLQVHRVVAGKGRTAARLLVVLLHGYGAPGDDLVAFARALQVPEGVVFLLPEAGVDLGQGRRAWWPLQLAALRTLGPAERERALEASSPPGLEAARRGVEAVVAEGMASEGLSASQVVVGGFSQGAMLATDVALHAPEPLGGLVVLSGSPLSLSTWRARMPAHAVTPVLLTHGRSDPVLAFEGAVVLERAFRGAGARLDTVYFDGGHAIPPDVRRELEEFLTLRSRSAGP